MTDWYVGMRVACIDASNPDPWRDGDTFPVEGQVYTIREILCHDQNVAILLVEIVNPVRRWELRTGEVAFLVHRFRPLVDLTLPAELQVKKRKPVREEAFVFDTRIPQHPMCRCYPIRRDDDGDDDVTPLQPVSPEFEDA